MSINVNDIVTVGKSGKVEYVVTSVNGEGFVTIKSEKSSRKVSADKLTVVKSFDVEHVEVVDYAALGREVATKIAIDNTTDSEGFVLILDGHAQKVFKSFDAAAFALSRRKGSYNVAVVASKGNVLVTR